MSGSCDGLSLADVGPRYRAGAGAAIILGAVYLAGFTQGVTGERQSTYRHDPRLRLDPNHATQAELMLLPEIGPKLARRIVNYRDSCRDLPAFRSPEDLRHIRGIGAGILSRLREHLTFPDASTTNVAARASEGASDQGPDQ